MVRTISEQIKSTKQRRRFYPTTTTTAAAAAATITERRVTLFIVHLQNQNQNQNQNPKNSNKNGFEGAEARFLSVQLRGEEGEAAVGEGRRRRGVLWVFSDWDRAAGVRRGGAAAGEEVVAAVLRRDHRRMEDGEARGGARVGDGPVGSEEDHILGEDGCGFGADIAVDIPEGAVRGCEPVLRLGHSHCRCRL